LQVVEDRVQFFTDLGNLSLKEASESDHASVMNCLVVSFLHFIFFNVCYVLCHWLLMIVRLICSINQLLVILINLLLNSSVNK